MKDYYKILGVNKTATKDEIKKAYRQLSKKYHPDVNPQGEKTFKDVTEAYETLSDENKRKQYDNPNSFGGFEDLFQQFNRRNRARSVPSKKIMVNVGAIDVYFGRNKDITYQVEDGCNTCNSTGGDKVTCGTCNGSGVLQKQFGSGFFRQITTVSCHGCNGSGTIITNMCFDCSGKGTKLKYKNFSIRIPKNINDGEIINIRNQGDYHPGVGIGNLTIKFRVNKENGFYKEGNSLIYDKVMSPIDIVTEKPIIIPHPDGDMRVNIPKDYVTDKPLRIKLKGYEDGSGRGDLYVNIFFKYTPISEEDKIEISEHFNKSTYQNV